MWFQRMVENQWNGKRSVLQCSSEQCRGTDGGVRTLFQLREGTDKQAVMGEALIETLAQKYNCRVRRDNLVETLHEIVSKIAEEEEARALQCKQSLNSIDNRLNESLHQIQRERENEIQSIEFKYEETVTKIQSDHSKVVRERERDTRS